MKILKVNEEWRCIEFVNYKGSMMNFNDRIKDLKNTILKEYINVVEENVKKYMLACINVVKEL